ncbi:MAG: hypothetical protein U5N26_07060 [Candidatus Marinimicrobia bacterium]|nr:hypothetical protein [Candidatus Neomarinimicrobiota bacterium]
MSSNDLLSCFGSKAKETRLTSFLAYLISLDIKEINEYFNIDSIQNIIIEKKLETQRCDIIVKSIRKLIIIEAKINNKNTQDQIERQYQEFKKQYRGKIDLISLTKNTISIESKVISSKSWKGLYNQLKNAKYKNNKQKILSEEFMNHLENSGIVTKREKQVYARDVNKEPYLSLFLKTHVYLCNYNENIHKCSYFAPYFGAKISYISPGVDMGLSYIAKIYSHIQITEQKELELAIKKHIKNQKLRNYNRDIEEKFKMIIEDHNNKKVKAFTLLLLEKPRKLFNPSIKKSNLQEGHGWLSKQYYEFDEIFEAADL